MKNVFLRSLMILPLLAATVLGADSYEAALNKAGRKPVVLFCYGADYDKVSERTYEEFIKKRGIKNALRGAVLVEVPIYQTPDEKQKKEYEKVMGKRQLPGGIWSYPCLAVVDAGGNLRGIVQSAEEMKNAETASVALEKLIDDFVAQEKILKRASAASGSRREALIAEASDIDINLPPSAKKGDPRAKRSTRVRKDEDESLKGIHRFNFDPLALVTKLQPMSEAEAYNYVRQLEAGGFFSRSQRQEMLAALGGHIRRSKGSPQLLRSIYTEMRNIDPDSMYGAYAEGALELWCKDTAGYVPPAPPPPKKGEESPKAE